jgi:hypothetical protein
MPTQEKLVCLANLLDTSPEKLRFGRSSEKTLIAKFGDGLAEVANVDQQFFQRVDTGKTPLSTFFIIIWAWVTYLLTCAPSMFLPSNLSAAVLDKACLLASRLKRISTPISHKVLRSGLGKAWLASHRSYASKVRSRF